MPIPDDVVTWGFRMLLGMGSEGQKAIESYRVGYDIPEGLHTSFTRMSQAQA